MLLVGSKALRHWIPTTRKGSDWDIIATREEYAKFKSINRNAITKAVVSNQEKHYIFIGDEHIEFEMDYFNDFNSLNFQTLHKWGFDIKVASPTFLFMLKKSHVHLPLSWYKHIRDYHQLKPLVDQVEYKKYRHILKDRLGATNLRWKLYWKYGPDLNKSNEEFFKQSDKKVERLFSHDSLHQATCYGKMPIYDRLKIDKLKAKIERHLFEALPHEDKIKCVREECFALALERRIIPAIAEKRKYYPRAAFVTAFEKIATTLTSGWFREFAIDNAIEIMNYDVDYVSKWLEWRIANTDDEFLKKILKDGKDSHVTH